jgi:oligosaccharide repeat unit polymerase
VHIVVISGALVIAGSLMAWRANRNWLSPIAVTVGVFLLFYIGGLFYFFTQTHALTSLYIALGIFFYGLGALLVACQKSFRPLSERRSFSAARFTNVFPTRKALFASLWITSLFSVVLGAEYFYKAGIPLLTEWSSLVRTEATAGKGIYLRSLQTFLPLAILITFLYHKCYRTRALAVLMLLLLALFGLYVIAYGARGMAISSFVPLLFALGVLYERKVAGRVITLIVALLLAGLAFQYTYFGYRDLSFSESVAVFAGRLTIQQVEALDYLIYDVIPLRGFYLGEVHKIGLMGILGVFRIVPYRAPFGEILFQMKAGGQAPTRFTLVTTTFGDLYADFGPLGICVGMLIYGMITQLLYIKTLRGYKDPFMLTILCYLQYIILSAHIGGEIFGILAGKGVSLAIFALLVTFLYVAFALPTGRVSIMIPRRPRASLY